MSTWSYGSTSTSTAYSAWSTNTPHWYVNPQPKKTPEQLRIEEGWDADDNGKVGEDSTGL
jgi:hypothetical protein